nr:ABC transporter A family member 9-like [Tanacetum cinerariifolium]
MDLWQSQTEDHTSDWLMVVLISGLGQTLNGKTYCRVLCYRLGIPLFSVLKPCSVCSRAFTGDIYGDHVISCAGIIGIKHGITLYVIPLSTSVLGSSPLTQTGMVDFVADHAVTDAARHSAMPFNNEDVLKVISLIGEKYGSDVHANMADQLIIHGFKLDKTFRMVNPEPYHR